MVSPVADRDSRDQESRGRRVVQMAPVRNKTAEIAEGRLKNSCVPLAPSAVKSGGSYRWVGSI